MGFDNSALSTLSEEISDRSALIMKPILGAKSMDFLEKYTGIAGQNYRLPKFETTAPWQAGGPCGFTTSGTTTNSQFTITTTPITIQEQLCLKDLWAEHTLRWVEGKADPETFSVVMDWVSRKQAVISKQLESAIWQGKTTYANATWLKHFNGLISTIDTAGDAIAATQQASISTSTVRGIFEDIIFTRIPAKILNNKPIVFCGMDVYRTLLLKLMQDNLYHYQVTAASDVNKMEIVYPGSNIKIVAVPGLNNDNDVETGSLPAAVKNRIFATYEGNLVAGMNVGNSEQDFDIWYSKDDRVLKMSSTFHFGVAVKYTDLVVQYTNS